jgi:hypothetical protein
MTTYSGFCWNERLCGFQECCGLEAFVRVDPSLFDGYTDRAPVPGSRDLSPSPRSSKSMVRLIRFPAFIAFVLALALAAPAQEVDTRRPAAGRSA